MYIARAAHSSYKVLLVKSLRQVSIIGIGLLGGSVSLAVRHRMPGVSVVGYSHRAATRRRAKALGIATQIVGDLAAGGGGAAQGVVATPKINVGK